MSVKESGFTVLREKTNATAGNLSVQIQKLKEVGYIDIIKNFKDNYPQTVCRITPKGIGAFQEYVKNLQDYVGKKNSAENNLRFRDIWENGVRLLPETRSALDQRH